MQHYILTEFLEFAFIHCILLATLFNKFYFTSRVFFRENLLIVLGIKASVQQKGKSKKITITILPTSTHRF